MTDNKQVETPEKYAGLTNEEILMIYFRFKRYLDKLNDNVKQKRVSKTVKTPIGEARMFMNVNDSAVQKFLQSDYFILVNGVVEKLQPLVDIISECEEYKKVIKQIK